MNELNEMYQKFLDMDDDERNSIASQCGSNIVEYLQQYYEDDVVILAVTQMFSVFSCVDGTVNYKEYELFTAITGVNVSYDDFYEATKNGTHSDVIEDLFGFIGEQDEDFMNEVFVLAVCIFTSNGTLTVSEQQFIENYFM